MLPKGWEIKTLGDLGMLFKGKGILKTDVVESGIPCIRYGEIYTSYNDYFSETISFINKNTASLSQEIQTGDILFAGSGETKEEIGKCTAYIGQDKVYAGGDIIILRPEKVDSMFLSFLLNSDAVNKQKAVLGQGQSVVHIYPKDIAQLKVLLPAFTEQIKIAKILSTFDDAIRKTSQLVQVKEKRKKSLMQDLLTGKIRFKGYTDKWSNETFGNTFSFLSTASYSRENLNYNPTKASVYYIHYGDIHAKYAENIVDFSKEKDIPVLNENLKINGTIDYLKDGDLILADASEDYEGVGKCIEVINLGKKKVIGGLHTFAARDLKGKTYKGFRPYIFQNHRVSNDLKKLATGSKVYGISKTNLSSLKLELPGIKEQAKIADILKSCDNEIKNLKLQLKKLQLQKQGLMQVLLTGKVRVKV